MNGKELKDELNALIGKSTGKRIIKYGWRELALYALAVGAGQDDMEYIFEDGIKPLPTFGAIPYWAAPGVEPHLDYPWPAVMYAYDVVKPEGAFLNMTHELIIHKPIPSQGLFVYEDVLTDIYDRGEGKGIAAESREDIYSADGTLLCTNIGTTLFPAGGGFGGKQMPKSSVTIPDSPPDIICEDYIGPTQHLLYRLTGDTNLIHVDPAYAERVGVGSPIIQGFCSIGFAVRMAVEKLVPGKPESVKRIAVQMTGKVYPGTPIELRIWRIGETIAYFRLINKADGSIALNKGVFEWK